MKFLVLALCLMAVDFSFGKRCNNIRPGLNKMRKGVDITKLDWLPLDQGKEDGFELSIIDFTCNDAKAKNRSLTTSFRRQGTVAYDIPDQVNNININPTGTLTSSTIIYRTAHDYQTTMSASADINYAGGLFSASASYEKIQNSIQKNENYVQESQVHVSVFNVELKSPLDMPISSGARNYIDRLPSEITKGNIDQFLEVIRKYGTHFIQTGKFGGSIRFIIETDQSYYSTHNEDKVRAEVGGRVSAFTGSTSFGYSSSDTDEEFNSKSTTTISQFGGQTNLLTAGHGLDKWQPTVKDAPMLYTGTLVPIYELIKDDAKKELIRSAYEIYLAKAHLADIKKKIEVVERPSSWDEPWFPTSFINKLKNDILNKITPLEAKGEIYRNDVVDLACEITKDINEACDNYPKEGIDNEIGLNSAGVEEMRQWFIPTCKQVFEKLFSTQGL